MLAQADQLHTDFGNRHQSYADQIASIKNRLGDKKAVSEGAGPASSTGHVIAIGGKNYRYNGNGPTNDLKSYTPVP